VRGEVVLKIARAHAAIFIDPSRGAQPRPRADHDESPTPAEDVRGTSTANPALVFIERTVEPVVRADTIAQKPRFALSSPRAPSRSLLVLVIR